MEKEVTLDKMATKINKCKTYHWCAKHQMCTLHKV